MMENFVIKQSKLHGNGIFATKYFPKNSVICQLSGTRITKADLAELPNKNLTNVFQIGPDQYLDLTNNACGFFNHHCQPTCYIKSSINTAFLLSIIPINEGDELTIDYSLSDMDLNKSLYCNCGVYGCRKMIGDKNSIPQSVLDRYKSFGIVQSYILK